MRINLITACNVDGVIGADGKLPWHIPEDLARFKRLTIGKPVIMGRKTFESLGCKPLKGRLNVVVSSTLTEGCAAFVKDLRSALNLCERKDFLEVFIIGGQRLYEESFPIAEVAYVTRVSFKVTGEDKAYFPYEKLLSGDWALTHDLESEEVSYQTWRRVL